MNERNLNTNETDGLPCPTCGVALAAYCKRCLARLGQENRPLMPTNYGCERCRGQRPELKQHNLGQEEELSKANSG